MANPLLMATTNAGKIRELTDLLSGAFELFSPVSPRFHAVSVPKVVEDGTTYFENALKKAVEFWRRYQIPVLADDSGLEVECLKGMPGVISAVYGGATLSWWDRWKYLQAQLKPFPPSEWKAQFRCVLCYYDGSTVPRFVEGLTYGMILPEARGDKGFGYDPLFFSNDLQKTFAEAQTKQKASVSHRARAVKSFLETR